MMLSAVEFLKDKLKKDFGFEASDEVFEIARKLENQNCQNSYELGIKQCNEAYQKAMKLEIENLKK